MKDLTYYIVKSLLYTQVKTTFIIFFLQKQKIEITRELELVSRALSYSLEIQIQGIRREIELKSMEEGREAQTKNELALKAPATIRCAKASLLLYSLSPNRRLRDHTVTPFFFFYRLPGRDVLCCYDSLFAHSLV